MLRWIICASGNPSERRYLTKRTPKPIRIAPLSKTRLRKKSYYSNPERRLYGREIGDKIQNGLKSLSEKERLVFELRHYQGLRLRMIGEIMGSTEETAKNYLFRATQKLRVYLAKI
jgi:RNA polymerase sigma factor (sigma-70 family)